MNAIAITMGLLLVAVVYVSNTTVVAINHHDHVNGFKHYKEIIGQEELRNL